MVPENEVVQPVATDVNTELIQARWGKRLCNYIIDIIGFYLVVIFWGTLLALVSPESLDSIDEAEGEIMERLIGLVLYGLYMGIIEMIFRGKTPGKFITGTKAVNEHDGSDISFSKALVRGFCRIVPFESLSALGSPTYPWHDKWTRTIVIDEREMKKR